MKTSVAHPDAFLNWLIERPISTREAVLMQFSLNRLDNAIRTGEECQTLIDGIEESIDLYREIYADSTHLDLGHAPLVVELVREHRWNLASFVEKRTIKYRTKLNGKVYDSRTGDTDDTPQVSLYSRLQRLLSSGIERIRRYYVERQD